MSERKARLLWIVDDDGMPRQKRGYECLGYTDIWWFPDPGYSMHGYETKREALNIARRQAQTELDKAQLLVKKLEQEDDQ